MGFKQIDTFYITTSVSELAHNIFFHSTRGGNITFESIQRYGVNGIEIMASDDGPGIRNIALAMQDGYSTNGGLGGGLPGVERLMDEFEITSSVTTGTIIVARKWQKQE